MHERSKIRPPESIQPLCDAFGDGLRAELGEKLFGVYLYGALTFPETQVIGDIDFHVVLADRLTEGQRSRLEAMHDELKRDFPPLGGELDGYYIRLADARRTVPPRSEMWGRAVDHAWALHRTHIHAGRFIALHGPDPRGIYPEAGWGEIAEALDAEIAFVIEHLQEYPDYAFCQLCRIVYTFQTRDVVVSKSAAADWGCDALPEWREFIELAKRSYGHLSAEERRFLGANVQGFLDIAQGRIAELRGDAPDGPG